MRRFGFLFLLSHFIVDVLLIPVLGISLVGIARRTWHAPWPNEAKYGILLILMIVAFIDYYHNYHNYFK